MAGLRMGSRGSRLALWQAEHVADLLRTRGHSVSIEVIKTTGDKITDVALSKVGTKGLFTKEIEEALRDKRIDLAVHSLKDLPTEVDRSFFLAAITEREDPRDAFLSSRYETFEALPAGAKVGTSSLRRQAQLCALRCDLEFVALRGNIDTRLGKLGSGDLDAIVLAAAGLRRLGLTQHVKHYFPPEMVCPAAGQGALAIEVRSNDDATREIVQTLDHPATRHAVECERAVLQGLGGGCQVPIGVHAVVSDSAVTVQAVVATPDGKRVLCETARGAKPIDLAQTVVKALLGKGAGQILQEVYGSGAAVPEQP